MYNMIRHISMMKKKIKAKRKGAFALMLCTVIAFSAFPTTHLIAGASNLKKEGTNLISGYSVDWEKDIENRGNDTYAISLKASATTKFEDKNTDSTKSTNGYYTIKQDGYYLIELFGGTGGNGDDSYTKGGTGGKAGYVYGKIYLEKGQTIAYLIGGNGGTTSVPDSLGGANGSGGGHGSSGSIKIGAGGGYSSVFLFNENEFETKYMQGGSASYNFSDADRNSKYILIAGGGGGGGGGNAWLQSAKGTADGGAGGNISSSVSGAVSGGSYPVNGTFYAGFNGKISGTNLSYIGRGGTNIPGAIATTQGKEYSSGQPNDWMGTYNAALLGGAGSSGNLRGGAGGAGFCGGSGGVMQALLIGNNVGGGGGGSSFVADVANNALSANESSNLTGNDKSTTGGYIAVTLLNDDAASVNNSSVSGTISKYFDIIDVTSSDTNSSANYSNGDFTVSGIDFTPSGDTENPNEVTVTVIVKAKEAFAGGNNVPIFEDNFNIEFDSSNSLKIEDWKKTDFVNVSLDFELITNNYMTSTPGTVFATNSLYEDSYNGVRDSLNSHWEYDFIESISEYTVHGAGSTVAPLETTNYDISYTVVPKDNGTAEMGNIVKETTLFGVATITVVEPGTGMLGKREIMSTKKLTYSGGVYELSLNVKASVSRNKIEPKTFTSSGSYIVQEDGWYAVQAKGGNGGNGGTATAGASGAGYKFTGTGGTGGIGGYAVSWYYFEKGDVISVNIGRNGGDGSSREQNGANVSASGDGGKGGSSTEVTFDGSEIIVAGGGGGGGGGGAGKYLSYWGTNKNGTNGKSDDSYVADISSVVEAESGTNGNGIGGINHANTKGGDGGNAGSNYSLNLNADSTMDPDAASKYNSLENNLSANTAIITYLLPTDEESLKQELAGINANGTISRYFDIVSNSVSGDITSYNYSDANVGDNKAFSFYDIIYNSKTETVNNMITVSTEFEVKLQLKPKEGFLGGNDVPVLVYNSDEDTGLSLTDGIDTFQIPASNETDYANVSLADVIDRNFTTSDKTIYYGDSVWLSELYSLSQIDGTDDWRADFAKLTLPTDEIYTPLVTTVYPITIELAPKYTGEKASVIAPVQKTSVTKDATVYVRFRVTSEVTNLITTGDDYVLSGEQYTATLIPEEGYKLPSSISVMIGETKVSMHHYSYDSTTGEIVIFDESITDNITIIAKADVITYTLHYTYQNYIGGLYISLTHTEEYPAGAAIDRSFVNNFTPNSVDGYEYYWDWGQEEPLTTMPAQDWWVNGSYVPISYTLTINYVGTPQPIEPYEMRIAYGERYSVISPIVQGYSPDQALVSGTLTEDTVITVNYTPTANKLNILYLFKDTNAQAAQPYNETVNTGVSYSVSSPDITGYTASEPVVSGEMTADGYSTIVYYEANEYTISFDADGGTLASQEQKVVYNEIYAYNGEEYIGLPTPIRLGYTFDGWYLGDQEITNDTVVSTAGDHTLKARWKAAEFTLTVKYIYASDESKAADDYTARVEYNTNYTAPIPAIDGYTTQPLNVSGIMPASNLVLFVRYEPAEFTLTILYQYEDGGEAKSAYTQQVKYNSEYSVVSPVIDEYEANMPLVSGIMPKEDTTRIVTYYKALAVEVDVEWTDLDYTYKQDNWNPTTHTYDDTSFVPTATDGGKITITNKSTIPVRCSLDYIKASGYDNVLGDFVDSSDNSINYLDFAKGDVTPQEKYTYLNLTGTMPISAKQNQSYTTGTVRVTVLEEVQSPWVMQLKK